MGYDLVFTQVPQLHTGAEITETEFRQYLAGALNAGVMRPVAHTTSTAVASFQFLDIPQDGSLLMLIWALDNDDGGASTNIHLTANDVAPGGTSGDENQTLGAGSSSAHTETSKTVDIEIGGMTTGVNPAGSHGCGMTFCHGYSLPGLKTFITTSSYYAGSNTNQSRQYTGTLETVTPLTELTVDAEAGVFVSGGAVTLLIAGGTDQGVEVGVPEAA